MKKLRLLLWKICTPLPNTIIEAPYYFSFWILKLYFKIKIPNCKIGYRNSLQFSCIEPLFSDLDITIICEEQFREIALKKYQIAKRLIPLLGELNLYSRGNFDSARAYCNIYERARDPLLGLNLDVPTADSKLDKFVFALRMLDADWETLRDRPSTRQKKWNFHFTCLGYTPMKNYDHDSVLRFILSQIEAENELDRVIKFRNRFTVDKATHLFEDITHPILQTLFFNQLCFLSPSPNLSKLQKEIIAAQARWEFWANEVTRKVGNDKQIDLHLDHMANFLKNL